MAGKGWGLGWALGNGASQEASGVSHDIASEFDLSMKKASYIDETPVPVVVMDCDHNIEYLNSAAALLAETTQQASIGLKLWDLFDNDACRTGTCFTSRVIREGRTLGGEALCTVKGRKLPIRTYVTPRFDEHQKVIGIVQVIEDNSQHAMLSEELSRLTNAAREGRLNERGDADQFKGGRSQAVILEVNQMLDAHVRAKDYTKTELNRLASNLTKLAQGDVDFDFNLQEAEKYSADAKEQFGKIDENLLSVKNAVESMAVDIALLTKEAAEGNFSIRADVSKHQGGYRQIVEATNDAFAAIAQPLTTSMELLEKLGEGIHCEQINEAYKGDLQRLTNGFNKLSATINALIADSTMLAQAGAEGKLNMRADLSKHRGDFRKIILGFNSTLDAVVGPMQDVGGVLVKLAEGDFTADVTKKYAGDFDILASSVSKLSRSVASTLGEVARIVTSLSGSAEELKKVSESMGSNADETATQASVVSAAAEQVSNNVQTVATGADEMSASIKEIAKNTAEATRVATSAVRTAELTNATISKLGQSSAEIGQVIKVITSIAQQTNLLALNATIEAARAGEAGKGFAVVANEVKELAKETAKATEDISRKIEAIQGDTNGAVSAISQISQVIGQISDIQTTIASAIEEQSATTNEIGRTLAEAAKGSTDISKNIGGVAEAAHATTVGAADTSKSAHALEKLAAELQTLMSEFRH
ncbi:MAG TPA: methyl-accepting chemotaxis protein [Candidatus Saccharimonadales bacterium]|nr:methyl-accepting chemotaxis protein [Candidatus Saccharimonadales bacterium]